MAELGSSLSTTDEERRRLLAELGSTRDRASALEARLADAEAKTVLAQRELAARDLRVEELLRSSKELEAKLGGAAGARDDAVQQVRVLAEQIATLSRQLSALDQALDLKQSEIDAQSDTIANLGQRLNVALASKVEELSQYRSEFFGELRKALGDREDVRIVGDRFVFQSEVLFGSGSDVIAPGGRDELAKLADALKEIIGRIPAEPALGAAGRRPHRPGPDQHAALPVQLGAVDRARHRRGAVPGRAGHPARPRRRPRLRRVPAPRPRRQPRGASAATAASRSS